MLLFIEKNIKKYEKKIDLLINAYHTMYVRLIKTLTTKKGESYERCTNKEEPPERVLLRNQSEIPDIRVSRKIQL